MAVNHLLTVMGDAKTRKGNARGYLTGILYLQPHKLSGHNLCAFATPGCIAGCLNTAGRGAFDNVQAGRARKTREFLADRGQFMWDLVRDIERLRARARKLGLFPAVRLNGTSDISWEKIPIAGYDSIIEAFPHVQFYDYTKNPYRFDLPANYHLTFSLAETEQSYAHAHIAFAKGLNVSVVYDEIPRNGWAMLPGDIVRRVINGDQDNLRFLDPKGVFVGLKAKGKARKDTSGFVH